MTYEEFCSFETLWNAYRRARRSKRSKGSTAVFEYNAIEELLILSKSLLRGTHQPDPLDAFLIYEPKKRLIQAPTFRDKVVKKLRYSSIKRMKRRIHLWEQQYAAGEISREKIMECFGSWEAHAKHGDTRQLREDMRARLEASLARAEHRRRLGGDPPPGRPIIERRTKRYGTVTFQSGSRQPGEAGRKRA